MQAVVDEKHVQKERSPIGEMLRSLRGQKTLRRVEADTGIQNSYLSNLETGSKRPGVKTLGTLADYYRVPLIDLLQAAGLQLEHRIEEVASVKDIIRGYNFVITDPELREYAFLEETPRMEVQEFVVKMYQHYTGKKLI